jgi:hypothetical protein
MRAVATVEGVAGALIVLLTAYDVFQTIVLPRPTPVAFRPSGRLLIVVYALVRGLALRLPSKRELLLGTWGPASVAILLVFWMLALTLGYGLMLIAVAAEVRPALQPGTAFYFAATSLFSYGFGDLIPTGALARAVVTLGAASGLGLFALIITFLFALFAEFQQREVLVITLSARAGAPPSGVGLLEAYAREGMVERLVDLFTDWEVWSARVLESHLSYPILAYFRSTHDNQSWISALGAVLDAATLSLTTVEDVPRGPARLMRNVGVHLVEDLGQYFGADADTEPYVEREEFEAAYAELQDAGFHVTDLDAAWTAFARARSEYAAALNSMAKRWVSPPAAWIGDRSIVTPHHTGAPVRR